MFGVAVFGGQSGLDFDKDKRWTISCDNVDFSEMVSGIQLNELIPAFSKVICRKTFPRFSELMGLRLHVLSRTP